MPDLCVRGAEELKELELMSGVDAAVTGKTGVDGCGRLTGNILTEREVSKLNKRILSQRVRLGVWLSP